ncbi:MAG: hypothetical protein Q4E05_10585 [Pseudoclavibacter sp.]|nr:hypothetical protein [Pseudoclavibacter sp.]
MSDGTLLPPEPAPACEPTAGGLLESALAAELCGDPEWAGGALQRPAGPEERTRRLHRLAALLRLRPDGADPEPPQDRAGAYFAELSAAIGGGDAAARCARAGLDPLRPLPDAPRPVPETMDRTEPRLALVLLSARVAHALAERLPERALREAERGLAICRRLQDPLASGALHAARIRSLDALGRLEPARSAYREAAASDCLFVRAAAAEALLHGPMDDPDAVRRIGAAVELLRLLPADAGRARARIAEQAAMRLTALERVEEACAWQRLALREAQAAGGDGSVQRLLLGRLLAARLRLAEAEELLEPFLERLRTGEPPGEGVETVELVEAAAELAAASAEAGRPEAALRLWLFAGAHAGRLADLELAVQAALAGSELAIGLHRFRQAVQAVTPALPLALACAERLDDPQPAVRLLARRAEARARLGQEECLAELERAKTLAGADARLRVHVETSAAVALAALGRTAEAAERWLEAHQAQLEAGMPSGAAAHCLIRAGELLAASGRAVEARALLERACRLPGLEAAASQRIRALLAECRTSGLPG